MPENLYPQLLTAPSMSQESFNIEMARKYYQDIVNPEERYTEKQRKYKNAYNKLLHASTDASSLRPTKYVPRPNASMLLFAKPNDIHQSDLLSLPHNKFKKKTYKYALNIVDVAIRYKGFYQLVTKNSKEVTQVFQWIYDNTSLTYPKTLIIDDGKEFYGDTTS